MNTPCRLVILALLPGLAILGAAVQGQAPAGTPPSKIFTNKTSFGLPVRINENERAMLQEVRFYVKAGPNDQWTLKETGSPMQAKFIFKAAQDGEYWFSVVTVDKAGRMIPADVNREPPGMIVVVDSQVPEVEIRPLTAASGEAMIQCDVKDHNPDPSKIKMEYQTGKSWQPLAPVADRPGLFRVSDPSMLRGLVRATAIDRAGNIRIQEVNLGGDAAFSQPTPSPGPSVQCQSPQGNVVQTSHEIRSDKVALPQDQHNMPRQVINNPHTSLTYQIDQVGPSGIGKVEIWLTRDEGQTWQRWCEDHDRRSPVNIDLPGDGLYGINLVVTTGSGTGGIAPTRGETPDWWVEVDTAKPQAQLLAVRPEGNGNYMITWTASDKNLKMEPIDLYYSVRKEGPWQIIYQGLRNEGNCRWMMPQGVGQEFHVRMEVADRAGNVTRCETTGAVVMDNAKPKARVTGVVTGRPAGPSAN